MCVQLDVLAKVTIAKFEQFSNAVSPIVVIEAGIVIEGNLEQL